MLTNRGNVATPDHGAIDTATSALYLIYSVARMHRIDPNAYRDP